jgi:hypothetical protein
LAAGANNAVKSGQVVPVNVDIGCDGVAVDDLTPRVSLVRGDVDPATDAADPTIVLPVLDASGVDDSGVMRRVGASYRSDLRVPAAAPGSFFTIRIHPFDGSPALLSIVLKIRK